MAIIRLTLAYDGTDFHGWAAQRDPSIRTVEGVIADGLERLAKHPVKLSVAGRTDAGVHARGQVASFSYEGRLPPDRFRRALNDRLSPEVVVADARVAPLAFDARFSATAREYLYRLRIGDAADPFSGRFEWHRPGELSITAMRSATPALIGEHDFTSFCRHPGDDRSTVRRLERISISRRGDVIELRFRANAFLHQMVRSLVGTLVTVGDGKLDPRDVSQILAARSRAGAPPVAPPQGLTLEHVVYGQSRIAASPPS